MLLLTGPPGSGKTQSVLDRLREAFRRGSASVCLLTPTATMAEHLSHELAREGLLVRPNSLVTLYQFVGQNAEGINQVSRLVLEHEVRQALDRLDTPEFTAVAGMPGFQAELANLFEEFSMAGCGSLELHRLLKHGHIQSEYAHPLVALFTEVEDSLRRRGVWTRGERIRAVAARIAEKGVSGLRHVLLDGFFTFTRIELDLIRALTEQCDVTVTLPRWDGIEIARDALLGMGFVEKALQTVRQKPQTVFLRAPTVTQETEEIARRVWQEASTGRPFREMGIVVRGESAHVPALRTALERFGIPARFYFGRPLASHPVVVRTARVVAAMLSDWDYEKLLAAIALAAPTPERDEFEFKLRERIPGSGLVGFQRLARGTPFEKLAVSLAKLDSWRNEAVCPTVWAERLRQLTALFPPPEVTDSVSRQRVEIWREHAAALEGWSRAMEETCAVFETPAEISLEQFWEEAEAVMAGATIRARDSRRSVVHVMDAYEARQWELPVVFVCGLIEKEFPRYHSESPLLDDAARRALQKHHLALRTSADQDREEEFLFQLATTRATHTLTLSYPEYTDNGDPNLPSFYLQQFGKEHGRDPGNDERPSPVLPPALWSRRISGTPALRSEDLKATLLRHTAGLSPVNIETYLQCPFLYFGRETLDLHGPPGEPADRLDALVQGKIVHEVLSTLARENQPLEPLFERLFEQYCAEARVQKSYQTEALRLEMLRSLERWLATDTLPPGAESMTERRFELQLDQRLNISGRIDRLEILPGGRALVVDYKYSNPDNLPKIRQGAEEGTRVQPGLYMLAARQHFGLEPAGMLYCALRKKTGWNGWHIGIPGLEKTGEVRTPEGLEELVTLAADQSRRAADEIRGGRIEPDPADTDRCEYCEFLDVCRVEEMRKTEQAGGGSQ